MLDWKNAKQSKPDQGKRVLLKIKYEECPVVGYWGAGEWDACTVNHRASEDGKDWDAYIEGNFRSGEVTHYAEIGDLPE